MSFTTGRDVTLNVYAAGVAVDALPVTSFEAEADSEIVSRQLLGKKRSERKRLVYGYKGSFEVDGGDPRVLDLAAAIEAEDLAGVPTNTYSILVQETINGTLKRYQYVNVVLNVPKSSFGGQREKVRRTINWEAESVIYL